MRSKRKVMCIITALHLSIVHNCVISIRIVVVIVVVVVVVVVVEVVVVAC